MKLLLDEMWPPWMAERLREHGHDVEAVFERDDLIGRPDAAVFAAAQEERRAIVTDNVPDYRQLAKQTHQRAESHPGLVLTSNASWPRHRRSTFGRLVETLDELLVARSGLDGLRDQEWWP